MLRRALVILLAVTSALGLAVAARVAWIGYGPPPGDSIAAAQVKFLQGSIAAGGGVRMQQVFPEGDFFLRALTAMAAARTSSTDLGTVRGLRDSLDAPERVAVFGSGMIPEHGIFQAGWALAVAVEVGRAWRPGRPGERTSSSQSAFRREFLVRQVGLVGVREYPRGTAGRGDVDSGPLLLGVSASASTVALAAARSVGETSLALDLSRQAELVGLPTTWGGERRYAFGALPVGDAFVAWARTRPAADPLPADSDPAPGRRWWPAFGLPFLFPLVGLIAIARPGRRA